MAGLLTVSEGEPSSPGQEAWNHAGRHGAGDIAGQQTQAERDTGPDVAFGNIRADLQ